MRALPLLSLLLLTGCLDRIILDGTLQSTRQAAKAFDIKGQFDPVWVTGRMKTEFASTGLADAGYSIDADAVEPRAR